MSNVLDDSAMAGPKQRPTFLTVLCILTFIGSGWGVIGGILSFMNHSQADIDMVNAFLGTNISINPIGYLINSVLCIASLFGAIQMWKLKKTGFFIYVGATVVSVVIAMVMLGGFSLGGLAVISIALSALFPILYALNLKHLS